MTTEEAERADGGASIDESTGESRCLSSLIPSPGTDTVTPCLSPWTHTHVGEKPNTVLLGLGARPCAHTSLSLPALPPWPRLACCCWARWPSSRAPPDCLGMATSCY